ncbi:MAG TPA: MBL fold metallo-hydrolase [Candidatus Acidoferrales bacterium]|nr:MBL fold metallo-hydrolase [Candidatus Acidoferrales bacterium]
MILIAPTTSVLDLHYLGVPETIGPVLLHSDGQLALIDCGPSSCLPDLKSELATRGLTVRDLNFILLTHIHLDHAGASGTLVCENPSLKVYVHEIGAPHMANPEKLLRSAGRLYGDAMQTMLGEFLPVPPQNLQILSGGEKLRLAGRDIEVAYTPGHASHHVSYFDQSTGIAYVGDTTGLRLAKHDFIAPVTPPPDIDLEIWRASLDEIRRRKPTRVCLTHYGPYAPVEEHLERSWENLCRWSEKVESLLKDDVNEADRPTNFSAWVAREMSREMPDADVKRYITTSNPVLSWLGLARYWKKKSEAALAG